MARTTRIFTVLAFASVAALGCSRDDPRFQQLNPGITKDSTLAAIGVGQGERPATYLVKGKMIEAMMIRQRGAEGPLDSLSREQVTPVVMIDGKLSGWGWTYWDSVSKAIGISK